MLVKRETSSSGVFDLESIEAADSSGVPTPRGAAWSNDGRSLGLPPPPSSDEVTGHARMPSVSSLTPLSLDTFEADVPTPRVARRDLGPANVEPSENERITVPAPAAPVASPRKLRRVIGAAIVAVAAVVVLLAARRGGPAPEKASAASSNPAPPTVPRVIPQPPSLPAAKPSATVLVQAPPAVRGTTAHAPEAPRTKKAATDARPDAPRSSRPKLWAAQLPADDAKAKDAPIVDPWHGTEPTARGSR
jgi:hypothetical protein